jgi:D-glycero-D-manno-heptose 1,7-bisphosphate phosphatase
MVTHARSLNEHALLPHVPYAVRMTRGLNYMNFVITNQAGVSEGLLSEEDLNLIMNVMIEELNLDGWKVARSRDSEYYKPNSMMIDELVGEYGIDRSKSWMVGDSWRDMEAGKRAGLRTIYIRQHRYGSVVELDPRDLSYPDFLVEDVLDAAMIIQENE